MIINKQSIEDLLKTEENRLCNDFIYKSLLKKVSEIDFTNVDASSRWEIDSVQHSENKGYTLRLIAKDDRCLPLVFYLWNFQVNIYIGGESVQVSDDAPVRNDKELEIFVNHLFHLFNSDVRETLTYSNEKLTGYKYEFIKDNNIIHKIQHSTFTALGKRTIVEHSYSPWIK